MEPTDIRYFYRNIVKSGKKYRIKYNNKDYGEFSKLSDALYERDCLFYCKFDYDLLVECDLPNRYENMELPPFPEHRPRGQIKGLKFKNKEMEGEIIFDHKERKFCVKRGDEHFGKYNTIVEAYYIKKTLIENDWDKACLIQNKRIREDIFLNKKIKASEPKLHKYCPNCGNKVKEEDTICKICGINLVKP
ncbi:MAG: zinc ribbon domain-containing protein [Methanobrevibacter sp.]|nr:zinc ribbon domain-containing protein [Methanobrevibacter sp.]